MAAEKKLTSEELAGIVRSRFLVPPPDTDIFASLDAAARQLTPENQLVVTAFRYNLASAVSTVAMPFSLASASVGQSHFQRFHMSEAIRALPVGDEAEVGEQEVHDKAHSRMREFVESKDGRNAIIRDRSSFLLASLEHGLAGAAEELLRQGLVLIWSAFEVLCRDSFETLLNQSPARVQALIHDPNTRKRFEVERLPLDTLIRYDFDLSTKLGTILVGQQDFSDLKTAKAVFPVLFPDSKALKLVLSQNDLWVLFQRRHLIVHRRGLVDQAYLDATGAEEAKGSLLIVTPKDFESALNVVVSSGTALAAALLTE